MKRTFKLVLFTALLALTLACVLGISVSAETRTAATAEELASAVAASAAGDTVEITGNITVGEDPVTVDKDLTVTAAGGMTITSAAKIFIVDGAELTLTGELNLTMTGTDKGISLIELTGTAPKLTIDLASTSYAVSSKNATQGNTTYTDECGTIYVTGTNAVVELKNGTLTNTAGEAIKVLSDGETFAFTMSGGALVTTSTGARVILSATPTTVTISGGTVTINQRLIQATADIAFTMSAGTINVRNDIMLQASSAVGTYHMTGGTINYVSDTLYGNGIFYAEGAGSTFEMTGGTLNVSAIAVKFTGASSTITVSGTAQITGSTFAQDSKAAHKYMGLLSISGTGSAININGGTLTAHSILANSSGEGGTISVTAGTHSVFDGDGNYAPITMTGANSVFAMSGGSISNAETTRSVVYIYNTNGGHTINMTGGTLTSNCTNSASWRGVVDITGSSVVVIGGTAKITDKAKNSSENGLILRQGTSHDVTIEGNARIEGGYYGIHVWYQPVSLDLKIKDNAYIGCNKSGGGIILTMKNASSVNITGGTIEALSGPALNVSNNKDGLTGVTPISISNATLIGSTYGVFTHALAQVPAISISNSIITGGTSAVQTNAAVNTITIKDGSVLTSTSAAAVNAKGNTSITVSDSTVTGGTAALDLTNAVGDAENAVTVTGGTLTANGGAAVALGDNAATVTVSGGTLISETGAAISFGANIATVTVSGGTLQGATYGLIMPGSTDAGSTLTVTGGTFKGASAGIYLARGAAFKLYGGTFVNSACGVAFGADAVSDATNATVEFYSGDFAGVDMMLRLEVSLDLTVGLPDDYEGDPLPAMVLPTSGGIYTRSAVEIWQPIFLSDDLQDLQTIDDLAYYDTEEHLMAGFVGYIDGAEPQYFTTLEGGIELAEEDGEIVLIKNIAATVTLTKSIKFSGSVALTGNAGSPLFIIAADDVVLTLHGDLVIGAETLAQVQGDGAAVVIGENVTVTTSSTALLLGAGGSVTIKDNVTVSAAGMGARLMGEGAVLTVQDSATLAATTAAISIEGEDVIVNVKDNATVRSTSTSAVNDTSAAAGGAVVFRSGSAGTVNVSGGLVTAKTFAVRFYAAGTLNFSGGTISCTDTNARDGIHVAPGIPTDQCAAINMTGGKLAGVRHGLYVMSNTDFTMTGGSYTSSDVESTSLNFWNEYGNANQDPAIHHITIGGDAKITVGGQLFRFLADEAYITFGGNAEISANYITNGANVPAGSEKYGNGGSQYITVQENVKLTSKNNMFINASTVADHRITLTVTGGTLNAGGYVVNTARTNCAVTVSGGMLTAGQSALFNITGADCTYNISGGTFKSTIGMDYFLNVSRACTVTISGGTFEASTAAVCIANADAVVTVEGGDFANATAILVYNTENANVTLGKAGAAITLPVDGLLYVLPTASAAQPTFAIDGVTPYSANGISYYDTQAHAEGGDAANAVAYIMVNDEPVYYLTLAAAVEAANAYNADSATVIVLRKNFKLDAPVTVADKKFVLTGEDVTVSTGSESSNYRVFEITGSADITVAGSVKLIAYNRVFHTLTTGADAVSITVKENGQVISTNNTAIVNESASAAVALNVTVQDNGLIRTDDTGYYTIYTTSTVAEVDIKVLGGMLDAYSRVIQSNSRTDITISGGMIRQRSTGANIDMILLDAGTPDDRTNTVTITGGTITGVSRYFIYARNATTLNVTGGKITSKGTFYNEWINTGTTNYTPTKTIVNIGGNAEITTEENGFQIISQDAEVTISGNAVITVAAVGVQFGTNAGKGVLNIESGVITAGKYAVNYAGANNFTATITGGTLTGGATSAYSGVRAAATAADVAVTVSGASKISGATSAVWLEKGAFTMYGGMLIAGTDHAIGMANGTVTIYGGTLRSGGNGIYVGSVTNASTLDLYGGSIVLSGTGAAITSQNAEDVLNLNAFNAVGGAGVVKNYEGEFTITYAENTNAYTKNTVANAGGAQVRLVAESSGLRFIGIMSPEAIANLTAIGATGVTYGTLILPTDMLAGVDAFTIAELERAGLVYLNVTADQGLIGNNEDGYAIRAAMVNIRKMNYGRNFSAVAYVTYTVNGQQVTQYAAYTEAANARSVAYVAAAALADTTVNYSAEQRAILQGYADYYVGAPVAMLPTAYALPTGKKMVA